MRSVAKQRYGVGKWSGNGGQTLNQIIAGELHENVGRRVSPMGAKPPRKGERWVEGCGCGLFDRLHEGSRNASRAKRKCARFRAMDDQADTEAETSRETGRKLFAWRLAGTGLRFAARASSALLDGLFPPSCAGCGRHVALSGALCGRCWSTIRFIEQPYCAVLGTPFSASLGEGAVSARAIADPPPYARARAAVAYEGLARGFVTGLKFRDRQDQSGWMAGWMARAGRDLIADADVVIPVPLHWRRFLGRRFNQSAELARALCEKTGKPFAPEALHRTRATVTQRGLTADERDANVKRAFLVPDAALAIVSGRRVLLVDDVITTGSTLAACARVLKKAGAAEIDCLAFAMVLTREL
jgi:ComF family protein